MVYFKHTQSFCNLQNRGEHDEEPTKSKAARDWLNNFQLVGQHTNIRVLGELVDPSLDVDVVQVCGIAGVGKSSVVKQVYYAAMHGLEVVWVINGFSQLYLAFCLFWLGGCITSIQLKRIIMELTFRIACGISRTRQNVGN